MADLVRNHHVQALALRPLGIERDAGIFHAAGGAGLVDRHRPGIRIPLLREVFGGRLEELGGPAPGLRARAFHRIHRHGQRGLALGQVDACRVPHIGGRGAEGHVAGVVHAEVPGQRATGLWTAGRLIHFRRRADHHRGIAAACLLKPLLLGRGQHVARVQQFAGTGHDHVPRHGDGVIEIAVFQIELAVEVGRGIPPAQVVVDSHARIPLRDLEDLAVPAGVHVHATAELAGHGEAPRDMQLQLAGVALQRVGQAHLHARVGNHPFHRLLAAVGVFDGHRRDPVAVGELGGKLVAGEGATGIVAVAVLVQLQPQHVQRVGAVVGVADHFAAVELAAGRIERGGDAVVGAVLPVRRPGQAAGGAVGRCRLRVIERRERLLRVEHGTIGRGGHDRQGQPQQDTAEQGARGGRSHGYLGKRARQA